MVTDSSTRRSSDRADGAPDDRVAPAETVGRPRDPEIDHAIIVAALEEVAAHGYAAATMAGIARRAGVPKSTVYRRWDSKQDLVLDALDAQRSSSRIEPTGDTRADIHQVVARLVAGWQQETRGAVTRNMLTEVTRNLPLFEMWNARLIDPFRQQLLSILRHGAETGQVRVDVDTALIADMILGLPIQMMLRPGGVDLSDVPERFVRMVFDGLAAR